MTDKEQIIIDGVDVKNCRRRIGKNNYCRYFKRLCSENNFNCVWKQLARKTQECEELKKQVMQKSEVDMFFNTPIEGWSNDPCGICPHKAENEELKKEIINKNEKIKELRFSVSDLTNRLCYLNAEKSFRIVDLEQTLDEIELLITNHISSCEKCPDNKNGYCIGIDECSSRCLKKILDIINKAKGEGICQ